MSEVTCILSRIESGDPSAAEQLMPLIYDELRKLASAKLAQEKPGQTLQATALVHDAYLRLVDAEKAQHWDSRRHFFAAAAEAMRRILVENARRKRRLKRGGARQREAIELDGLAAEMPDDELLVMHDALEALAREDACKAKIVELRFFGGMPMPEVAETLGISLSTAERGWRYARAWLYAAMEGEEKSQPS